MIKILTAKDSLVWYKNYIGHSFILEKEDEYFWVRDVDGRLNIVFREDAEKY